MIKMRRKERLHGLALMCFGKDDGDGDGWAEIILCVRNDLYSKVLCGGQ